MLNNFYNVTYNGKTYYNILAMTESHAISIAKKLYEEEQNIK